MSIQDQDVDEDEIGFIKGRAEAMGVKPGRFGEILEEIKTMSAEYKLPESNAEQVELIRDLALLVLVDGKVRREEIKYGEHLCKRMGYDEVLFRRVVSVEDKRSEYFAAEWQKIDNPTAQDYRNIMMDAIKKFPLD